MCIRDSDLSDIISKFNEACLIIRSSRLLCDIHKKLEPSLDVDNCHVCEIDYNESDYETSNMVFKTNNK